MNTEQPNTKPTHIDFYFDPISPYAWLASHRLNSILACTGMRIIVHPVLFAGLLKAHGNIGPVEIPAKRAYTFRDVMRRAADQGLHAECPPNHPFNPLLALRVCTAITDNWKRLQAARALMHAAWGDGMDITLPANVHKVLTACELDADRLLEMAQDTTVKQQLITATADAVERGVFGVPTFCIGDHLFWGADRTADLNNYATGSIQIDEAKLSEVLAREAAVQRKR